MNTEPIDARTGLDVEKLIAKTGQFTAYGRTGIGGRSENQDNLGGWGHGEYAILTVCDGMGGMNGGQTASFIAAAEIVNTFFERPVDKWTPDLIVTAVNQANQAIYRRSVEDARLRGMGTTATVLMITPEAAYATHIGDSRIYQLRNGKKVFRTFDHSKVFEMVAMKMMTEEQARTSTFSNVITQALGIRPTVNVEVTKLPYKAGDRFVLCCDGIWNCVPEPEMVDMLAKEADTRTEVIYLTEEVNALGMEGGGGHDNLTAIVVDMKHKSEYQYGICKWVSDLWQSLKQPKSNSKNPETK